MIGLLATEAGSRANFVSLDVPSWAWVALLGAITILLVADLLIVHRTPHEVSIKAALVESSVWIALGLTFGLIVAAAWGGAAAGEYYGGYLIEKSLSIDNVFVWAVILSFFGVPPKYQFRVLFWGVFGALVMRAIFIFAGVALLERFDWVLYIFGAILLWTAWRIYRHKDEEAHPENNPVLGIIQRFIPSSPHYDGQKLFTVVDGARVATPLFAVLVLVEATDVVFAVDSVPAILAVSREPFIVWASNAFAILGLRALYFALAGMAGRFRYLDVGLAVILAFVGVKMLLLEVVHLPIGLSVGVIGVILTVAIVASLRADARDRAAGIEPPKITSSHAGIIGREDPSPSQDGSADRGAESQSRD